jgi:oligopeptide transport system substrate-binding protein
VTGAGSNDPVYSSPAFDAKLVEAERALDPNQSYALVNQAQAILLHDLPVIPLWDYTAAGGVGPGVTAQLTWNGLADFTQITKGDVAENTKG